MNTQWTRFPGARAALLLLCLLPVGAFAQAGLGGVNGQITDPSGAAVPGAVVTLTGPKAAVKAAETNLEGRFVIEALEPGQYTLRVSSLGFALFEKSLQVAAGRAETLDIRLKISVEKQEVTVADRASVDVDPSQNVGAIILKGDDLNMLSDNPEDLEADLQALAGPSAGPNGGQIYIDGFTGGRLPPKESIREIRINQNPFSSEYDRLGYGRIEIFTKPGADKIRGQAHLTFGDSVFNSRNPFSPTKPSYQTKMFGGNLGGPLGKKSSFFIDMDRRDVDETSVISALTLDDAFNFVPFHDAVLNPTVRTTVSPRIDYQLNPNNTLTARYTYADTNRLNEGIGEFSLPSTAFNVDSTDHSVQITETAVLNARAINETRFQYMRRRNNQAALNFDPTVSVLDAFTGGGASVGLSYTNEDRYELQNMTSLTRGPHFVKFGARLRGVSQSDRSMQNYNGRFTFTSLDAYRITMLGLENGLTPQQIRAAGGGASQFSITGGNPLADIRQFDIGLFIQDDWRLRPNFSLNLGLRYETQNHINNHMDFAPRVGFAWGVGGGSGRPKTVIRGGVGLFYDRFGEDLVLQAQRLDGISQQQFLVPFPDFFPNVPSLEELEAGRLPSTIRRIDPELRSPYIIQGALGIERQLPKNISVSLTYTNSRGLHQLRSRNINAPLPGSYDPGDPSAAVRPFGEIGNIYVYESGGIFKQNQLMTNINARVSPKFTLFGFYVLGKAESNTDGAGSFPANQYDLTSEFGRAAFDVRHRAFIGGSVVAPLGFRLSPFITASSGRPFNITTGRDGNGDSLFNDRPALALDLSRPSVVVTPYGAFDTQPLPRQITIPRNYGDGPGQFSVNLRLSRTFGFGGERSSSGPSPAGEMMPDRPPGGGGRGGPPGGGSRGFGGGPRGGPGGMHGIFADSAGSRKYSLTFSISARNLFNTVNLAPPVGNLSSPLFGTSNAIAGGFGPFGSATANRRIEMQLRFSF